MNQLGKPGIALAGASGSHPAHIRLLSSAIADRAPDLPLTVFDMTAFDTRGRGIYEGLPGTLIRPRPADAGVSERFRTGAPNIVISGGTRAFSRLIALFEGHLDERPVSTLLVCHSWGLPEQALIRAARSRGIAVFEIDEGPFSLPLRGTRVPESSRLTDRAILRVLRAIGLFPPRDVTGALIDRVLVTAPGRYRRLIERGVDEGKLVLVPPPRFDRLASVAKAWRERSRDGAPKQVLWLHQPFRADGKIARDAVDRAEAMLIAGIARCAARFDLTLTFRLHPRSDRAERERLTRLAQRSGVPVALDANRDLYDSLMEADAAVGFYSSALLEAVVCGMPAVAAEIEPRAFRQKTEGEKAAAIAALGVAVGKSIEEIEVALAAGLDRGPGEPPEVLLDEEIGRLNGQGAATVAQLLIAAALALPEVGKRLPPR